MITAPLALSTVGKLHRYFIAASKTISVEAVDNNLNVAHFPIMVSSPYIQVVLTSIARFVPPTHEKQIRHYSNDLTNSKLD